MTVYFIASRDALKIGFAVDVRARLSELQTGNAHELVLVATAPGTVEDERALHRRFAAQKVRGEWFRPDTEILSWVAHHAAPGPCVRVRAGRRSPARKPRMPPERRRLTAVERMRVVVASLVTERTLIRWERGRAVTDATDWRIRRALRKCRINVDPGR